MTGSNDRDRLDEKHARNREQRLEAVKRWAEYIKSEPPEVWGPLQTAVVDGQLEAAQHAGFSAEHRKRVKRIAAPIHEERKHRDEPTE